MWELAEDIEESGIRLGLKKSRMSMESVLIMQKREREHVEFLRTVQADYLPQVEKMTRKYIQMEKLDETAKDTFVAGKFGAFLENFPGMDGL